MKVIQRSFKWRYLKIQIFRNFSFTNPGNVQNQIIPRISIFVILKIKGATKSYIAHYSCVIIVLFNRLYVGLHFLRFLLENYFSSVLTLNESSPVIINKLPIKVLQYYVKICFQWCFEFFKFIKKSVEQSWNKECKKRCHKKVSYESFSSMYKYSIRCLYFGT